MYSRIVIFGCAVLLLAGCVGNSSSGDNDNAGHKPPAQQDSTLSVPANISIRQGGVVTLAVGVPGHDLAVGSLSLSGPSLLELSGKARLYDKYKDALGYSFGSIGLNGGRLTLYVGRDIPVGSYPLTVTGNVGGDTDTASLTLQVLKKGNVYVIRPTGYGSLASNIASLQPGDVLVLHQGIYTGYLDVDVSGTSEKPITIRGYGLGEAKPVLKYTGGSKNQWDIYGSNIIVQGLAFHTPATYSIRIRPSHTNGELDNISIINDTFVGCGTGCIGANNAGATYRNIRMTDNLMLSTHETPVYVGNHHGTAIFQNFLFEGNVIDGRTIVSKYDIGYGIEVKLNVQDAVIRHNYIVGTRGPGLMIYGLDNTKDSDQRTIVKGNIVIDSCKARNILIGAGPAVVKNNVAMGGHFTGFAISDYGSRHLSDGIVVTGNTALLNQPYGFWITTDNTSGIADLIMTDNLAYPSVLGTAYKSLPVDTTFNVIQNNGVGVPTTGMQNKVTKLEHIIPSPQDLKKIWPLLADGPLNFAELTNLLGTLVSLPTQSTNPNPRSCP